MIDLQTKLPFATAWIELESFMLSEISQAVRDKYHMISPTNGTLATKLTSKQNITRDIEIKNKLAVTTGEVGGDNREKEEVLSRNMYNGHMDKAKVGLDRGWEVGMAGVGGSGGGKKENNPRTEKSFLLHFNKWIIS